MRSVSNLVDPCLTMSHWPLSWTRTSNRNTWFPTYPAAPQGGYCPRTKSSSPPPQVRKTRPGCGYDLDILPALWIVPSLSQNRIISTIHTVLSPYHPLVPRCYLLSPYYSYCSEGWKGLQVFVAVSSTMYQSSWFFFNWSRMYSWDWRSRQI